MFEMKALSYSPNEGMAAMIPAYKGLKGWLEGARGLIRGVNYEFPQYKVPMTGPRLCTHPLFSTFPPTFASPITQHSSGHIQIQIQIQTQIQIQIQKQTN